MSGLGDYPPGVGPQDLPDNQDDGQDWVDADRIASAWDEDVLLDGTIQAEVHEKGSLFLRVGHGTARSRDGKLYDLCASMTGSPIIGFPDGRSVSFSWSALLAMAISIADEAEAEQQEGGS